MVCHIGRWVTSNNEKEYVSGEEKGVVVSNSIKFREFVEIVSNITSSGIDMVTLAYSVPIKVACKQTFDDSGQ